MADAAHMFWCHAEDSGQLNLLVGYAAAGPCVQCKDRATTVVVADRGAALHRYASDTLHLSAEPNNVVGPCEGIVGGDGVAGFKFDAAIAGRDIPQQRRAWPHRSGDVGDRRQWF